MHNMLQEPHALAAIPADDYENDSEDQRPQSPAGPDAKRQRTASPPFTYVDEYSMLSEPAESFVTITPAISDHERILAEFCLDEEDNAESVVARDVLPMGATQSFPVKASAASIPRPDVAVDSDDEWGRRMVALIRYGIDHGTYEVPFDTIYLLEDDTDFNLGAWVFRQKALKSHNGLSFEREARFEPLLMSGRFTWSLGLRDKDWQMKYDALMKYFSDNGHCNPPCNYVDAVDKSESTSLGEWVQAQRQLKRDGGLGGQHDIIIAVGCRYSATIASRYQPHLP